MTPLRILYHHRIRAEDGQAVHVRELIRALRAQGHEVLECALVPKAAAAPIPGAPVAAPPSRSGGLWQRLHLPRAATECAEILYSGKGVRMLLRAADRFAPDFIYERHALHCRAGLDAARRLGVPLLLEVNSPICDEMAHLGRLRFPGLARRTERAVLAGADRVLAVSRVLADRLVGLGAAADKVRVVRNGADPARLDESARERGRALRRRLGLTNGQLALGFVGYMRTWHRLDLLLEAMARIPRVDLHLLLVGTGPALPDLMRRVAALGLTDRVHPLGVLDSAEVPAACAAFDVAVIPAINEYASPLKLFDSLAAGVATLALDQPNIRELLRDGETGVLFAGGDLESLSGRLVELAADRDRLRSIGAAGRQSLLANRWTWAGSAERVVEAFQEVR